MPILWNRRRIGKALAAGVSAGVLGGLSENSHGALTVLVSKTENDDPVDMSVVEEFELVGNFVSPLSANPDLFWLKVRSILDECRSDLGLHIKKAERSPDQKVFHAYRLQARSIKPNTRWRFLVPVDWEVWVQFLIRQRDEDVSGLKVIDVKMAVGERPTPRSGLRQLKPYAPAKELGDKLLAALQSGMAR